MEVGRKIYYNKVTGDIIWDKGEMQDGVRETTFEEDKEYFPLDILEEEIDFIQLQFGELRQEFKTYKSCKVDVTSKTMIFEF